MQAAGNSPRGMQLIDPQAFARLRESDRPSQPRLAARMASYELAARMQLVAGDALDLSQETETTRKMYGIDQSVTESYGRRCLIGGDAKRGQYRMPRR